VSVSAAPPRANGERVLFLDFDGVLNSERFYEACRNDAAMRLAAGSLGIDAAAVQHLNHIVERTGAQLVISSSWRRQRSLPQLRAALGDRGLVGVVRDVTPLSSGLGRGGEIHAWLQANPVAGFVVLDDLPPSSGLDDWWLRTDPHVGLTKGDRKRAIELCLRPGKPL
jgi:hypothetical protein